MVNQSRNSGTGKRVLMGCGCVAAFMMVGIIGLGMFFVPKVIESAQEVMADMEFAQNWNPPADDIAAEELFPEIVSDFKRSDVGGERIVGIMGVDSADGFAIYKSPDDEISVFMKKVNSNDKDSIFADVSNAIDEGDFSIRSQVSIGDSMTFSVSSPHKAGKLWWSKGWMFFFYKTTSGDAGDFADEFLETIQAN